MEITIKDKSYELKKTFRSILIYEEIKGELFNPQSVSDILLYFYSTLLASNPSMDITFNDFLQFLDENPDSLNNFVEWIELQNKKESYYQPSKKKKVKN